MDEVVYGGNAPDCICILKGRFMPLQPNHKESDSVVSYRDKPIIVTLPNGDTEHYKSTAAVAKEYHLGPSHLCKALKTFGQKVLMDGTIIRRK